VNTRAYREALEVAWRTFAEPRLVHRHTHAYDQRHATVEWDVINVPRSGKNFRYRVTRNDGPWAINIHGYFAGGSMYARESQWLAATMGWKVVNPSLPAFGGSDPLDGPDMDIDHMVEHIEYLVEELGITAPILVGHSMGAAVAMQYARRHPRDVAGIIYRDGIATPQWSVREGGVARLVRPFLPHAAPMADLVSAVALDAPDLLIGHLTRTVRAVVPELAGNVRTLVRSFPFAAGLLHLDLTEAVREVAAAAIPLYPIWGCFDRVVPLETAEAFAQCADSEIQYVPGGHSWMLARPAGLTDLLTEMASGRQFVQRVEARRQEIYSLT
jgi:pimeloyl-ACP methyl ester carboxylesterase